MSDYIAAEVQAAIEQSIEAMGGDWGDFDDCGVQEITLRGETVEVHPVASYGGEGMGNDIWFVVRIGDQLFEKDGYYASHYGTDWDGDFYEVKPAQKTVTIYKRVRPTGESNV